VVEKKRRDPEVLIATRVTEEEQRLIRAAASLDGEKVTDFLRGLAVPAAMRRMEIAAREIVTQSGDVPLNSRRVGTVATNPKSRPAPQLGPSMDHNSNHEDTSSH
jgi:uncharacterized protein (DUF1778 family)